MNDILPEAIRLGLEQARKAAMRSSSRLCVHDGEEVYRIHELWDGGFAIDAELGDKLRGRVEIYDGARHLYQCLIIGSEVNGDLRVFEFKWLHAVADKAPTDFVLPDFVPAGLIAR